jgi:hypothetical protein
LYPPTKICQEKFFDDKNRALHKKKYTIIILGRYGAGG